MQTPSNDVAPTYFLTGFSPPACCPWCRKVTQLADNPQAFLCLLAEVAEDILHTSAASGIVIRGHPFSSHAIMLFRLTAVCVSFSPCHIIPGVPECFKDSPDLAMLLTVEVKRGVDVITMLFGLFQHPCVTHQPVDIPAALNQ